MFEKKNNLSENYRRLCIEKKINELEGRAVETIQNETEKKKLY